jgi:hypothetical protein
MRIVSGPVAARLDKTEPLRLSAVSTMCFFENPPKSSWEATLAWFPEFEVLFFASANDVRKQSKIIHERAFF